MNYPLYGIELLAERANDPVMIVASRAAADAARVLAGDSYVVVTWPNGELTMDSVDWSPLAGRRILLWPEADQAGWEAMLSVAAHLKPSSPEIKLLETKSKAPGWDAASAVADGWTWNDVRAFADGRLVIYDKPQAPAPVPAVKATATAAARSGKRAVAAQASVELHVDDGEAQGQKESFGKMWAKLGLQATKAGVVANADNVLRALEQHKILHDVIWFDEFHQKLFTNIDFNTWETDAAARPWQDVDTIYLMTFLQRNIGMTKISISMVEQALTVYAHSHKRNEPREWLRSLRWDKTDRIAEFFLKVFGVEASEYSLTASKNFWIAMVARLLRPGCQVDNMIILEGEQGAYKSSALRLLGGSWSMECSDNILQKDFKIGLQGRGLVIINEWDKFKKADAADLKDIISTPVDSYRPVFGKHHVDHKRTSIFIATTNKHVYLTDPSGLRRYWPLRTQKVDKKLLVEIREQCYAEAVWRLEKDETWWEMPVAETKAEQEARRIPDAWESVLEKHLEGCNEAIIEDLAKDCLNISVQMQDYRIRHRIGECLTVLGFTATTARVEGRIVRLFKRGGSDGKAKA